MDSPTVIALLGFVLWTLFLLIVMEVMRVWWVLAKKFPANEFKPDNSNLSPFLQRLARAHANCIEGIPVFGGLFIVALLTEQTAVTDPLAYLFLAARIAQSLAHLLSLHVMAVNLRFVFFSVQLVLGFYWAVKLISALVQ
ncbi:MAPEG family protein [Rheinheimera sp. 1928-s]|uniref:MAPEG family protein n=1 Tax=Rheinheimera sp. 1928-s TaxID=3033803 RepID=UPI00262D82E4|nr:MAPEG family protein [Rheinheimera sp. 1928-s]MDF3126163.1 MAPEG family protein [Rheinheimera sp. 1928-s]